MYANKTHKVNNSSTTITPMLYLCNFIFVRIINLFLSSCITLYLLIIERNRCATKNNLLIKLANCVRL